MSDPRDDQIAALQSEIMRLRVENEGMAFGVRPEAAPDFSARILKRFGLTQDGELQSKVNPQESLGDYVQELRSSAAHLFQPAGARPRKIQGNPFKTETLNLTEAGALYRQDPAKAAALANEANFKLADTRKPKSGHFLHQRRKT